MTASSPIDDVAAHDDVIGDNDGVADLAIVRHVRDRHEHAIGADAR